MDRSYFLDLAASGLRMPYGVDLVLQEQADPAAVRRDGRQLGAVLVAAAKRYKTPLACPLMDLTLEKKPVAHLVGRSGERYSAVPLYRWSRGRRDRGVPEASGRIRSSRRCKPTVDAAAFVADQAGLLPMGMAIGPFSLMTKLIKDPIASVYLGGLGMTAEQSPEVALLDAALEMGIQVILRSIGAQIAAGAQAIVVCEPAANSVYISPKQMVEGSDVFERYVLAPNRRIKTALEQAQVCLVLHDCGELTEAMVRGLAGLHPAILSLGGSRRLWEDAALVPFRRGSVWQPAVEEVFLGPGDYRRRSHRGDPGTRPPNARHRASLYSGHRMRRSQRARLRSDDSGENRGIHDLPAISRGGSTEAQHMVSCASP